MNNLDTLFADYNPNHSEYQIKNYIIGLNGRTQYGQYKQALRELYPRYLNIKKNIAHIANLEVELDEWGQKQRPDEGSKRYKLLQAEKVLKQSLIVEAKNRLTTQLHEFKQFYSIATQIKSEIGTLTPEMINALEADYWETTFKEKIALEILAQGRPSKGTLETILAMPERNIILTHWQNITEPGAALTWLMTLKSNAYTPGDLLSDEEAYALIENTNDIKVLANE
jgi:hypothetical protein